MKLLRSITGILATVFVMVGCKDKPDQKFLDPVTIFLDYKILAREGDDNLTILLQFRDGYEGDALPVRSPGSVQFDGEMLHPDSAKMTGYFYEIHRPISSFTGKHEIVYTDLNQKVYKEEFEFKPLVLVSHVPDTIDGTAITLEFSGIDSLEYIQVVYRDTSFNSDDSRIIGQRGENKILLNTTDFERLKPGPVQYDFIKELSRDLKSSPAGGQLVIMSTIQKELFLRAD